MRVQTLRYIMLVIGINVRIHSFDNSNPDYNLNSSLLSDDQTESWNNIQLTDPIRVKTIIADGYYMFNGKKFSYAAAYDQSVLHRWRRLSRSCRSDTDGIAVAGQALLLFQHHRTALPVGLQLGHSRALYASDFSDFRHKDTDFSPHIQYYSTN